MLSKKQIAEAMGRDERTIIEWQNEGMPHIKGKGGRSVNQYNLAECNAWAIQAGKFGQNQAGRLPDSDGPTLQEEQTRLTRIKADRAQLALDEERGKVIKKEDVTVAWRNRYAHIKRHLLLWSKRLPGRLVGLDEREIADAVEEEVHHVLSLLSRPGKFTPEAATDE